MKSVTVQYVNVHKRSRKIKNYSYLTNMDRSSKDIFNPSVIEDFYPTRPNNMEDGPCILPPIQISHFERKKIAFCHVVLIFRNLNFERHDRKSYFTEITKFYELGF